MLIQLWKYLYGYVIIEVYGFSVERFLNLATHKGIYLWDVHREGNKMRMSISVKGYKMLRPCARKTRCRIRVVDKVGLPFILHRYRKRRVFLLGFFLMLSVLWILSSFIWTIEVQGNESISMHVIQERLKEEGCEVGDFKYLVDTSVMEKNILKKYSDISWISMEVKGTGLFVYIEESTSTPEFQDFNQIPSNIRAEQDCVVEFIVTRSGRPLVKKGDVIKKGDLLVTGELELLQDDQSIRYKYTYSDADIKGRMYEEIKEELPAQYIYKDFSGKKKYRFTFAWKDWDFSISNIFRKFEYSDAMTHTKEFYFFSYKLPMEIIVNVDYDYTPVKKTYKEDEAIAILERRVQRIRDELKEQGNEIIHENLAYNKSKEFYSYMGRFTMIHEIGKKVAIKERKEWTEEENNPLQ